MPNQVKQFEQIYLQTYSSVLGYTLKKCGKIEDIEDILQEIYTELFQILLQKEESYIKCPEGFMIQLAKSRIYQYYCEKAREKVCEYVENLEAAEQEAAVSMEECRTDWEDILLDRLTAQEVMEYVSQKDELTKEVFYQHYFQDRTLKEIAKSCGVREMTVKNRLYRTLKELRGWKKLLCIGLVLLLAALLAKPVYTWAEDAIAYIKKYMSYALFYKDCKEWVESGKLSSDISININGTNYTFQELEEIYNGIDEWPEGHSLTLIPINEEEVDAYLE